VPETTELASRINRVGTENAALRQRLQDLEARLDKSRRSTATRHAAE
jgi:BMFP domain-containing protein YqiC